MPDKTITARLAEALRTWHSRYCPHGTTNADCKCGCCEVSRTLAEYDVASAAGTLPEHSEAKYNRVVSLAVDKGKTLIAQRDAANADAGRLAAVIENLFRPGPGIATIEKHEKPMGEPYRLTWNTKVDMLTGALAAHRERTKGEQNAN